MGSRAVRDFYYTAPSDAPYSLVHLGSNLGRILIASSGPELIAERRRGNHIPLSNRLINEMNKFI